MFLLLPFLGVVSIYKYMIYRALSWAAYSLGFQHALAVF